MSIEERVKALEDKLADVRSCAAADLRRLEARVSALESAASKSGGD